MIQFRHNETCMGTVFQYFGRTELTDEELNKAIALSVAELHEADEIFSRYKPDSPISRLARGETELQRLPEIVEYIWDECERWEKVTDGWFRSIDDANTFDPSGLVKAWATENAALKLVEFGITDFAINAGGDIRMSKNISPGITRKIGISKPISIANEEAGAIAVLDLNDTEYFAVATSGSGERGEHIWVPKRRTQGILQVTVVAKDIITADVFATAAFAAGDQAGALLGKHEDELQAMVIDLDGNVFSTKGFAALVSPV